LALSCARAWPFAASRAAGSDAGAVFATTSTFIRMFALWTRQTTQNELPGAASTVTLQSMGPSMGTPEFTTVAPSYEHAGWAEPPHVELVGKTARLPNLYVLGVS